MDKCFGSKLRQKVKPKIHLTKSLKQKRLICHKTSDSGAKAELPEVARNPKTPQYVT